MRDYLELGPTPVEEECVQVRPDGDYIQEMKAECNRFKALLEKKFPDAPAGVYFFLKRNEHDFGTYYEVAVSFDADDEEQAEFAYKVEGKIPMTWEDE